MINSPTAEEASLKFLKGAWTLVYNIFEFLFGFTPIAVFFWIMIVWYGNPFLDTFYVDCHFLNSTGVK